MSWQLRCCRCGCNTFRKVQESVVELFAWDDGNEVYAREERVAGSPSVSSFVCERCGSAAAIPPAQWARLRSHPYVSERSEGE